ncbi:hypothetical protein H0H93_005258 [Arthromyces matolae]|nr:hypothetical protein H0H93_005258 [Arthromyces matolae]
MSYFYQPYYSTHYAQAHSQLPIQSTSHSKCPPGHSRCTYKTCQFTAAPKALEIHMMDRHLIFPPDWNRRPKRVDWDADPSLKGKPITIQGTNINLDKPEDLEAWIAERKRRWPTSARVEDKKRKMEEAIARGQILEPIQRNNKRAKIDEGDRAGRGHLPGSGRGRGRGNTFSRRGRSIDSGWQRQLGKSTAVIQPSPHLPPTPSDSDSDDAGPEIVSSKNAPVSHSTEFPSKSEPLPPATVESTKNSQPVKRPPPQPKGEPYNPFASRPTLLRNLLLPEIRITISNLSQAIRFLVDNDFLDGVELTPGAAEAGIWVVKDDHDSDM